MIDFDVMKKKAALYGVVLNDHQLEKLNTYAEMLVEWNEKMNLTGITDPDGIMIRHFEDSLAILRYIDIPDGSRLIDVGTGAGFPGLVLKIVRPEIRLTLLDSLQKRITFLEAVCSAIGCDAKAVHLRAEDGGRASGARECFDFACARAVAEMRELSEYCIPFVRPGGTFFALKGPDIGDELSSARPGIGTLGGKIGRIEEYAISDGSRRTLVVVSKIKATPDGYPRAYARIKKKPL